MNKRKLLSSACLLLAAMIYLPAANLAAQTVLPPDVIGDSLQQTVITSASGAERNLTPYVGYIGRAGLLPEQLVGVTLKFSPNDAGKSVSVSSPDGGEIITANHVNVPVPIGEDGTAFFDFQASKNIGVHRILVRFVDEEYRLDFYVLDPVNTARNPPRLRVVE